MSLKGGKKSQKKETQSVDPAVPLFGDPEDYKNISAEEREKLTQTMLNRHKVWAENPLKKSI